MMRRRFGSCCLLAALVAGAAEEPFMSLLWGSGLSDAERPAAFIQLTGALERYPSCFDEVMLFDKQTDKQMAEALKKLGISAATVGNCGYECSRVSDDHAPRGMIGSALLFAARPEHGVAVIGNGRNCASGKSAHGLCVESLLYLAYGAGGLAYDLTGYAHEPMSWYANTYMSELALWRPFFEAYVRYNADTKPGGILPFCGKSGRPELAGTLKAALALAPLGLPMCPGAPWPVCYILNAASVESMTAVDIQRVLSGGVLLDGGAVAALQARGCGAAMQLSIASRAPEITELFTDDELNLGRVNYLWQPDAAKEETFALYPSNEAARVIGRYQHVGGRSAEAASVLTETPGGGRLAAFGFAGFGAEVSAARRTQLLLAADWVAQGRLPVFVETVSQVLVVPRVTQAGDLRSVVALNASIDVQPPVTLRLRGCKEGVETMEWVTPKEKPVTVAVRWEAKDALVVLPAIGPWQVGWLRPET